MDAGRKYSAIALGTRIGAAIALVLLLLCALGTVCLYTTTNTEAALSAIVNDSLPATHYAGKLADAVGHIRALTLMHIGAPTAGAKAPFRDEVGIREGAFRDAMAQLERTATTPEHKALLEPVRPALESYLESVQKVLRLSDEMKTAEANELYVAEARPRVLRLVRAINAEVEANKARSDGNAAIAMRAAGRARYWTWAILVFSLLAGGGIAYLIGSGANRELRAFVDHLRTASAQVASAAAQISRSSQSLASGASEQAASVEETSASGEEVNAVANRNAENSEAASAEMGRAAQTVAEANARLENMVGSMREITESSQKISRIIRVIEEIAFQTNILALNAAVEAARAGEAGMGFAVVADEVRSLAHRSAQAARDTTALIGEAIEKSTEGSRKLDEVAEGMTTVTAGAGRVKMLVDEVNLGSHEQARGIAEIGRAISQIGQVAQKNAASAEESASAAQELGAQSEALQSIVAGLTAFVAGRAAAGGVPERG